MIHYEKLNAERGRLRLSHQEINLFLCFIKERKKRETALLQVFLNVSTLLNSFNLYFFYIPNISLFNEATRQKYKSQNVILTMINHISYDEMYTFFMYIRIAQNLIGFFRLSLQ
jgi:hypothetical protein